MKTLIELYTSFLASVGMTADNQGFISTLTPGSDTARPFSVDSKRWVLPVPEQLNVIDWSGRVGFHPLLQNVATGDSRVLEKFRDRMNAHADFMTGMLFVDMAQLAVKKGAHQDLTPQQAKYLGPFSDADGKFVKLLMSLVSTKRVSKKNFEFVRFSVIKGRVYKGQKRSRVATMHFPLYDALPKDDKGTEILGHKFRVIDVKMLRRMYEFLFPGIGEPERYEVGSDSKIAPSMESLMSLYGQYTSIHNTVVFSLANAIESQDQLLIVDDWREDIQNIEPFIPSIRQIPWLEGNAGSERVVAASAPQRIGEEAVSIASNTTQAPVLSVGAIPQAMHQPVQQQQFQPEQQVTEPRPRFKLGAKSPTVTNANPAHQLPDQQPAHNLSYQRPAVNGPSVGAAFHEPVQAAPLQQAMIQPLFAQPVQQPQAPQPMKVPDSARLFNNQLYIPVESSGVSALPAGGILIEGKVFVPLNGAMGATQQSVFQRPGQSVLPGQQTQFGMPPVITDASQIPGLTPQEVQMFQQNPAIFQNYLQQMQQAGVANSQQAMQQRQSAVPRYLQRAAEQAQQNQFNSQRGYFTR